MTSAFDPARAPVAHTRRERVPGKARALGCLATAELLAMALWFSASAVLPQLSEEWALGESARAWMTTSVQIGFVAGALASALASVADLVPSHRLFAGSAVAGALATAAIPLLDVGPGGAVALRFVTGFALAGVYPPGMKLAASWSREDRGLAIGLLVGALTLGSALPHLLNALPILGEAGLPPWRSVLLATSALAIVAAAIVALFVAPGPFLARTAPFDWRLATRAFTVRPLRLANLGYLGHMWEVYAMWTWVPILLIESYRGAGLSLASARLAGFAAIGVGALGCVLAGLLADRLGRTTITIGSLAVSGACCLAAGSLIAHPLALTALCLLWGLAVVADSAQFSAAVSELADPSAVGTALTVQTCLGFLLTLVSIQLVPPLVEAWGWNVALPALALGPAAGIAAMATLRRAPESTRMASGRR